MQPEYRTLAALFLRSQSGVPGQEQDQWIARELAKQGYSSALIHTALLSTSPHLPDGTPAEIQEYVAHLVQQVMELSEVIAARQALFGNDDEEEEEEGPVFFGDF
jgi:hypothetical protein